MSPPVTPEVQALIDQAAADARRRAEDETRRAVTAEFDRKKAEQDEIAKGNWQKIAEDRQTEIDRLTGEVAKRDRQELCRTVAKKHGLPADAWERLKRSTDAELEADAKALAKLMGVRTPPASETGNRNGGGGSPPASPPAVSAPTKTLDGRPLVKWGDRA